MTPSRDAHCSHCGDSTPHIVTHIWKYTYPCPIFLAFLGSALSSNSVHSAALRGSSPFLSGSLATPQHLHFLHPQGHEQAPFRSTPGLCRMPSSMFTHTPSPMVPGHTQNLLSALFSPGTALVTVLAWYFCHWYLGLRVLRGKIDHGRIHLGHLRANNNGSSGTWVTPKH